MGRAAGMERDLLEREEVRYVALPARAWLGHSAGRKAAALATVARSSLRARRLLKRREVNVVLGTGGYVSAPAVVGALLARRPSLLLEPNAHSGTANRWLSRISSAACLGYQETGRELSCRTYWTGVPVRPEFFDCGSLPEDPVHLLVLGGSQGAQQINLLIPEVLALLAEHGGEISVTHQVGRQHVDSVRDHYARRAMGAIEVEVTPFISDMPEAMRQAQIIVSRAGALTLAEIAAAGRPSVLIPLAGAAGHQAANAARFVEAGAALTLGGGEANAAALTAVLQELLADRSQRRRMSEAARSLAKPEAATEIGDLLESYGGAA